MNWTQLDWKCLDRLRGTFLAGSPTEEAYWQSPSDLANYDLTFGERIGWKWDAVLDELELRGWRPPAGPVLDWGCGSGVAGRRVLRRFGASSFGSIAFWDRSALATDFAHDATQREFPGLDVSTATPGYLRSQEPIGLLLISHVLNELPPSAMEEIRSLVVRSRSVVWTEPGTREVSRALGALRDAWAPEVPVVAPCTHAHSCPVLAAGNERHWCHFFGFPPPGVLADSDWVKFAQRAGIDLRSLPYSFLALDRSWKAPTHLSRVIGRPEHFKPYARLLNCDASGLAELSVMKRGNPALFKELDKSKRPLVYAWTRQGEVITGGSHVAP